MKLVTLIENTTRREDLTAEHGLSLYIEANGKKILFDTGASGAFADNAETLGVDLGAVDFAVLSHGHYDHGGGLSRFLEINKKAPVYLSLYGFEPHYNAAGKEIGLDPQLQSNPRLIPVEAPKELAPGIWLHTCPLPPADTAGMTVREGDVHHPEDFRHEQYLMIEEADRHILISGCSHKGILNLVAFFRPDILIGGFHFMKVEDEAVLTNAAKTLLQYDTRYYTGHCTGQQQYALMKMLMGERLQELYTGSEENL